MQIVEDTKGKTRDLPIAKSLKEILFQAGNLTGVDEVKVTSGGQCAIGTCAKRMGSTRHDLGRAADLELWKENRVLDFTNSQDLPVFEAFVTAAARLGATGMGAGIGYMGSRTIHVGFGKQAVWGASGSTSNAPAWLKSAAIAGWASAGAHTAKTFSVAARNGLRLRAGPGSEFGVISTVEAGTIVVVDQFDGENEEWARVDLKGDGLYDGHLHKSFLIAVDSDAEDVGDIQDDCGQDHSENKKQAKGKKISKL